VLPDPTVMGFNHDAYPVSRSLFDPATTAWALLAWTALGLWLLAGLGRASPLRLALAWFLVAHLLTSSPWPLEMVFEHRNYAAALVLPLLLAPLLARWPPRAAIAVLLLALAWQSVATLARSWQWGDPVRLAVAEALRAPESSRANFQLGVELLRQSGGNPASPLWRDAMTRFERAAALPEAPPSADQALLVTAARAGMPIEERWWAALEHKARHARPGPEYASAFVALAQCRYQDICPLELSRVVGVLSIVAHRTRHPDVLLAYAMLAWRSLGDTALALRLAEDAVAGDPGNPNRQYMLGQFQVLAGDLAGASASADRMRALDGLGRFRSREADLRRLIDAAAGTPASAPAR
jgi:protein O-mannosyl-transferase